MSYLQWLVGGSSDDLVYMTSLYLPTACVALAVGFTSGNFGKVFLPDSTTFLPLQSLGIMSIFTD